MFSVVFDFLAALVRASLQVFAALGRALWDVLSAFATAILWPFRAIGGILLGRWDLTGPWTSLYFLTCGLILLVLAGLIAWGFWKKYRRRDNH